MNRLIIIGNGFDLAHGLKTSYNDFILWYLKKCLSIRLYEVYEDDLVYVKKERNFNSINGEISVISYYVDYYYQKGRISNLLTDETISLDDGSSLRNPFTVKTKSKFIWGLILNCSNCNWVDIESYYYSQLKKSLEPPNNQNENNDSIDVINNALTAIKNKLEEYLKTITTEETEYKYREIFFSDFSNKELANRRSQNNGRFYEFDPANSVILNFNYTDTIEKYNKKDEDFIAVNYIHGKIGDPDNPLIFGFGDELDANYAKIELKNDNKYLEHIKSFGYFRTSNYHNLIRFVDDFDFQVFLIGHSCGLSDRTMLNMIFEHENCKSIKIYYYKDNYKTLTQEISRHFKDKVSMRRKIVPFDKSDPMPQV